MHHPNVSSKVSSKPLVNKYLDLRFKFVPTVPTFARDVALLRTVVGGMTIIEAAAAHTLSIPQTRVILNRLAIKVLRAARNDDPSVKLVFTFTSKDFARDAALWIVRLDRYLPTIEQEHDNA